MNQTSIKDSLKKVLSTAYNHKIKLTFLLVGIYLLKKAYDLYKFLKPFLQMKRALEGGSKSAPAEAQQDTRSESQKKLDELLSSYPELRSQLKMFQTTIKNINNSIMNQPVFINSDLLEKHYQLKQLKEKSQEEGITSNEKILRWSTLKNALFQQLFSQIYCNRIINSMTAFQISLTGQKYFRIDIKLKGETTQNQRPEGLGGLLALMDEDDEKDEEEKKAEEENKQEMQAKADEERKLYQEAAKDLMTKCYELLIKKACQDYIIPLINEIVESVLLYSGDIKGKYSINDIAYIMDTIHEKIIQVFFKQEPKSALNSAIQDQDTSIDSDDSDQRSHKSYWLVERFFDTSKQVASQFSSNQILNELFQEILDLIEVEYFESVFCALLHCSYKKNLVDKVKKVLTCETDHGEAPLFGDLDEKQPMVKIVTRIYQLQQNEYFITEVKNFDFKKIQESLDSVIKFIYFKGNTFEDIEMSDIMKAASEQQRSESGMGGLEGLLGGINIDQLMQMFDGGGAGAFGQ